MSGLELLAVVGCVAAVISAYNDGSELVRKLRQRRLQKKALLALETESREGGDSETEELETTLIQARSNVQRRYDRDYRVVGERFASGDQIARDQLKDIIIQLQGQVITNLKYAWHEESVVNFQELHFVSDDSQVQTIHCLIDLHKRMMIAAPIVHPISDMHLYYNSNSAAPVLPTRSDRRVTLPVAESVGAHTTSQQPQLEWRPQPGTMEQGFNGWTQLTQAVNNGAPLSQVPLANTPNRPILQPPTRQAQLMRPLKQEANGEQKSKTRRTLDRLLGRSPESSSPAAAFAGTSRSPPNSHSIPTQRQFDHGPAIEIVNRGRKASLVGSIGSNVSENTTDSLEHNPWAESDSQNPGLTPSLSSSPPQYRLQSGSSRGSTGTSLPVLPEDESRCSSSESRDTFKEVAMTNPRDRPRFPSSSTTGSSTFSPMSLRPSRTFSTTVSGNSQRDRLPGEHNSYRGLCKSAFRLQTDHRKKAMKVAKRPIPGSLSQMRPYWSCTECEFEGALMRDSRGTDLPDSSIRTFRLMVHPAHRDRAPAGEIVIRYRWGFLFRSHLKIKEMAQAKYSCVFCCCDIQAGFEQSPVHVFTTHELLLKHIAEEHVGEGKWPDGEVMYRMACVVQESPDVVVDDDGWDIMLGFE